MKGAPITVEKIQEIIDKHFKDAKYNENGIENGMSDNLKEYFDNYKPQEKVFDNEMLEVANDIECWIKNENGVFMFLLFNYDWGFITCQ